MKGNVVDMAVGVIIGGAFGKIVTSLVSDVIMPLIGMVTGGIDLTGLNLTVGSASVAYGAFLQNVIDFLIIALCIFIMIKAISKITRKKNEEATVEAPAEPGVEEKLLTEIRDLLKQQQK